MKEGLWVAIDGIDAVGKSTQVPLVSQELRASGIDPVSELKEFSDSPVGRTITGIIEEKRFYSLNESRTTPLADTLHLLSDIVYNYETVISPTIQNGGIAISDRGSASFIAYQSVRLGERSAIYNLDQAVEWTSSLASHALIVPDLTILIKISQDELMRRIVQRGEEPLESDDLSFLNKANDVMEMSLAQYSKNHVVLNGELPIERLTEQITEHVLELYRSS